MAMFRIRLQSVLLLLVGCALVAATAHFWMIDRQGFLRLIYPAEAAIARHSIRCSPDSPVWLADVLRQAIDDNRALSNQVAYVSGQGRLHHCESGWQGAIWRSPALTAKHRFRYASLSKLLTADAVLRLASEGRLSLDARLLDFLPEVSGLADDRVGQITLRHLLMHQAGFDRLRRPDPMFMHNSKPWCPYALQRLASVELSFSPGDRHAYANLDYCLLGVVLERVTGERFRDWVSSQYALNEAGMRFVDGDFFVDEVRYDFRNSPVYGEDYSRLFNFYALSSSAGLSGSASAFAQMMHAMLRPSLSITSAELPEKCNITVHNSCYGYAFYALSLPKDSFRIYVQSGALYGLSALAIADSEGGALVWLGNGMSRAGESGSRRMASYLLPVLAQHYGRQDLSD